MKSALVLGINGNFGSEITRALLRQGWSVKTVIRPGSCLAQEFEQDVTCIQADIGNQTTLLAAATDVSVIVYGINPPYTHWSTQALKLLEPTAQAAEQLGLCILFPGNVYHLTPSERAISEQAENTEAEPPTTKGVIRHQMEQRLLLASKRGANILIVRAGDFIGPSSSNTWIDHMLKKDRKGGQWRLHLPHAESHTHYYSYLPDLCHNAVSLLTLPRQPFEIWHDPGLTASKSDWQNAFGDNGIKLRILSFPWWTIKVSAVLSPMMREILQMRYLWQQRLILNGGKMKTALGSQIQVSSLKQVVFELTQAENRM